MPRIPKFPVLVKFDDSSEATCKNMKELKNAILNAHSEGSFCDSITDDDGNLYGCHWDVKIVTI